MNSKHKSRSLMKRLHLFLIKTFLGPFIATFFITVFILLMQFLWKYIDDLVGKGLDFSQISELLFYATARFIPLAAPIAMLLSSVMVFGKLAEQYELVALKSSGISLYKLLFPLLVLVTIISFCSFLFSNYVMPIANLKNGAMIYDIQKKKPALNIKEGVFYKDIEGFSIKVNEKDNDGTILKDIIIYDHTSSKGNNKVLIARKGKMKLTLDEKYLELFLFDGHSYYEILEKGGRKKKPFRTTHFKKEMIRFNLESFNVIKNSEKLYKGHYAMLNNKQLSIAIDSLEKRLIEKKNIIRKKIKDNYLGKLTFDSISTKNNFDINNNIVDVATNKIRKHQASSKTNFDELNYRKIIINKHKIEWHRKISLAFACLILFMIGAPLGAIIKKGGFGYPVLVSVIFFIFFHVLNMIGEKAAKELTIQAYEGMWLSNIIFLPIAIFLIFKAKNDSILFDLTKINLVFIGLKNKYRDKLC